MNPKISVILPTYNEAGNIIRLICELHKILVTSRQSHEIILVDDNSPDQTAKNARNFFFAKKFVKIHVRKNQRGLASAIFFGISKSKGKWLIIMDTDFNHDPNVLLKFIMLMNQYSFIIGSRFINGGGMENKLRNAFSLVFNLYLRILLGHHVHDNLSGFFAIKKNVLNQFTPQKIFYGFGDYFIRLIYYCCLENVSIVETPVFYKNRIYGTSKSNFFQMFLSYSSTALKLRLNA